MIIDQSLTNKTNTKKTIFVNYSNWRSYNILFGGFYVQSKRKLTCINPAVLVIVLRGAGDRLGQGEPGSLKNSSNKSQGYNAQRNFYIEFNVKLPNY